ncbi:MAG: putative C-S lyase [Chloroflexi bacterium]|nr:putative C-S lyase [Chloroflexota bacterium]
MSIDFDRIIDRRSTGTSEKWNRYPGDVIGMSIADMDFAAPDAVIEAIQARVQHPIFGYEWPLDARVKQVICERMARLYDWVIEPEQIVFLPDLVVGFNLVTRAVGAPGDGVLVQTPLFGPILKAPANQGRVLQSAPLRLVTQGSTVRYEIDFDVFEAAITPRTRLFILCHPHNPAGRDFTPDELRRMAAICERRNIVICSDEVHADLLLGGTQHTPIATIAPEVARRTVTLMAPTKTFNMPSLEFGFAIITDAALRAQMQAAWAGSVPHGNVLGLMAAIAAYTQGDEWLFALREYLTANRDALAAAVAAQLPGVRTTVPEATYLAWLDCRAAGITGSPWEFFLKQARVVFTDGEDFGPEGRGCVRLNFGTTRAVLNDALGRMQTALNGTRRG